MDVTAGCSHVCAQVSCLLEAEPIQRTKSANSGDMMGRTSETHAKHERSQSATDLDCRLARRFILAAPERAFRGRKGGLSHKDVKNEGRSDYVYENKASTKKSHAKNTAFYTKIPKVSEN
jgi:hypothetical protein